MSEYARFDLNAALCRSTSKSHTFVVNCIVVTTIINTRSFSRFFLFLSNSLILSLCVASAICMPWLLLLLFCYFRSAIDKFLQEKEFNFLEKRYSSGSDLSELSTLFCLVMRMKIFINSKLNTIIFFYSFSFRCFFSFFLLLVLILYHLDVHFLLPCGLASASTLFKKPYYYISSQLRHRHGHRFPLAAFSHY